MKDRFSYEGKRVLVGGCASGIGAATAQGALELGATVVGLDVVEPTVALDGFVAADLGDHAAVRWSARTRLSYSSRLRSSAALRRRSSSYTGKKEKGVKVRGKVG